MASQWTDILEDERCGLYFLAGLDEAADAPALLTVHAARGTLTQSNRDFIRAAVTNGENVELRILEHSDRELRTPESLEDFAVLFDHDSILKDPTGAFSRMGSLVDTARRLRNQAGDAVRHILWQAEGATLVVVTDRSIDAVRATVETEIGRANSVIRAAHVLPNAPAGRFTPVDRRSIAARPTPVVPARSGLFARMAGAAALIGLGAISAANAAPTPNAPSPDSGLPGDSVSFTPGMTALSGLTTLGENAYGRRNHYQAVGGLRLYFGEAGKLMAAALRPEAIYDGQAINEFGDPSQDDFDHPMPLRVQSSS